MPRSARSVRRRLAPVGAALLLFAPPGCVNQIGITCPPDDPGCDQPDLAATSVPDLRSEADASHPPDLWECKNICPDGCCDTRGCQPLSLDACGARGEVCSRCDPLVADNCKTGKCACGTLAACPSGSRCAGGKCTCDSTSCPKGCCDPTTGKCNALDLQHCALQPGGLCKVCDPSADTCAFGAGCTCGVASACGVGQRCDKGGCVCDGKSCPNGCCQGNACLPGNYNTACGTGGNACTSCQLVELCAFQSCTKIPCVIGKELFCINPLNGASKCGVDCVNCGNFAYQCPNGTCVESCKNCPGATATCITNMAKTCTKDCQTCPGQCTP